MSIKTRNINSNYRIDQDVPDESDVFRPSSESGYQYSFRSWSSTYIAEEDWNQPDARDILDIEKMAEERIESLKHRITRHITEAEMRRYIPLAEADFEDIKQTEIRLERAYELFLLPKKQGYCSYSIKKYIANYGVPFGYRVPFGQKYFCLPVPRCMKGR